MGVTQDGVFGVAPPCLDDGTFTLQVDMFDGVNALVAQVTDALGQNGPNSATVNVVYDAPPRAVPGTPQHRHGQSEGRLGGVTSLDGM